MKSLERATNIILNEARENRNDSPVDYGYAEAIAYAVLAYVADVLNELISVDDSPEHNQAVIDCIDAIKPSENYCYPIPYPSNK